MDYVDKTIECVECGTSFTFTASEQEFFASKGYTNQPKRCSPCRQANKQQRRGSSGGYDNSGGGYQQRQKQMYPAVCASCGIDTQVPFEPRDGRPVYCSDCYSKVRR